MVAVPHSSPAPTPKALAHVDLVLLVTPLQINQSRAMTSTNALWALITAMVFRWDATTQWEASFAALALLATRERPLELWVVKMLTSV